VRTRLHLSDFATLVFIFTVLSTPAIGRMPYQTRLPGGIDWSQEKTSHAGIDAAALEFLYSEVAQESHQDLKGIVIVRNGRLAGERYFNGDSFSTLHDIRSATKSITSLLMGIAIQKGLVHSVHDSIALYLSGLPKDGKEKITIKDLLNMRRTTVS
jgi:CubicO group peptidase (beta-lactamase class C family)